MREIVYRIENGEGCGPFWVTQGNFLYDAVAYEEDIQSHISIMPPSPLSDAAGIGTEDGTELREGFSYPLHESGFLSKEQLVRWFPSKVGRNAMEEGGFFVSVFCTEERLDGNWQVAFDRDTSELIGRLSVETLEPCDGTECPPLKR